MTNRKTCPDARAQSNARVVQPSRQLEPCFLVSDFNAPSHLIMPISRGQLRSLQRALGLATPITIAFNQPHFPAPFTYNEPGITWTPKTNQEPDGVFDALTLFITRLATA
jgi:hypothetical protein